MAGTTSWQGGARKPPWMASPKTGRTQVRLQSFFGREDGTFEHAPDLIDGTYGMYAEGPIKRPADLGPALRRGVERVKAGEPALIDVVSQPR